MDVDQQVLLQTSEKALNCQVRSQLIPGSCLEKEFISLIASLKPLINAFPVWAKQNKAAYKESFSWLKLLLEICTRHTNLNKTEGELLLSLLTLFMELVSKNLQQVA